MVSLRWGAATNPGRVRNQNEDTFVAEPLVFAVADGMGGHQAGEVASALAASILRERLGEGAVSEDAAVSAVAEANMAIHGAARANAAQSGMGTTLTALAVLTDNVEPGEPDRFVLLNVGDSRTYRFRQGRLQRVTVDHSYVQELVATGHITVEEARTHPRRNIVTRALGIEPAVRADMWTMPIVRDDRFVLCSDGLVDEVADADIAQLVASIDDPQHLAEQLVEMANQHGGRDNVTVVVVDVLEGADPPDPTDEIEVDPSWADSAPPSSLTFSAMIIDDELSEPITLVDQSAVPTLPPPSMPLPPDTVMTDVDEAALAGQQTDAAAVTDLVIETEPEEAVTEVQPAALATVAAANTATVDSGSGDPPPAEPTVIPPRKRRFTFGVFLFVFVLALIVTVTLTFIAVHARSGYFVGFEGDTVVVFKGQRDTVLWFKPTVEARSTRVRDELEPNLVDAIEDEPGFDSLEEAAIFIDQLVTPTTSTTVPESTTTSSPPADTSPGETTTTISGP